MARTHYPPAPLPPPPFHPENVYAMDLHAPPANSRSIVYSGGPINDYIRPMQVYQNKDRRQRRSTTAAQPVIAVDVTTAYEGVILCKAKEVPPGKESSWLWVTETSIDVPKKELLEMVKKQRLRGKGTVEKDRADLSPDQRRQLDRLLHDKQFAEHDSNADWIIISVEDVGGLVKNHKRRFDSEVLKVILKRQNRPVVVHNVMNSHPGICLRRQVVDLDEPLQNIQSISTPHNSHIGSSIHSPNGPLPSNTGPTQLYSQALSPLTHAPFQYQDMPSIINEAQDSRHSRPSQFFAETFEDPNRVFNTTGYPHPPAAPEPSYWNTSTKVHRKRSRNQHHQQQTASQPSIIRITTGSSTDRRRPHRRQTQSFPVESDATSVEDSSSSSQSPDNMTPMSTPPSAGEASPSRRTRKSSHIGFDFLEDKRHDKAYWNTRHRPDSHKPPRTYSRRRPSDDFPSDHVEIIPNRTTRTSSRHQGLYHHENAHYLSRHTHPQDRTDRTSYRKVGALYGPSERRTRRGEVELEIIQRSEQQRRHEEARRLTERQRVEEIDRALDEKDRTERAERERVHEWNYERWQMQRELDWHRGRERELQKNEEAFWENKRWELDMRRTGQDRAIEYRPRSQFDEERSPMRRCGGGHYHV